MSNLLKERARTTEKTNQKKKQEQRKITVGYTLDGRAERQRLSKGKRAALTFCIVLCSLAALIYLPPLFYKEPEGNTEVPITPDSSAIKTYLSYLKDHPDDDFDECAQRCNAAHRAEADKQAERQSEYQRQAEKLYGGNKAAHQAECYIGKHVVSSLPLFYFDT